MEEMESTQRSEGEEGYERVVVLGRPFPSLLESELCGATVSEPGVRQASLQVRSRHGARSAAPRRALGPLSACDEVILDESQVGPGDIHLGGQRLGLDEPGAELSAGQRGFRLGQMRLDSVPPP